MINKRSAFKKGHIKKGGRKKGVQNKVTRTVKDTVLKVFNDIQSDPKVKLSAFAKRYPRDFYAIASRLIPTELTGNINNKVTISVTAKKPNT